MKDLTIQYKRGIRYPMNLELISMRIMSNLEYSFMASELSGQLSGKHFSRIRKLSERTYRMKIGNSEILFELGVRLHETMRIEKVEGGDKFTEKVEKELDNARLVKIEQVNNDRIIAFVFDKASFILEMFGEGNAILVRDNNTVCAHRYEAWSDREIKAGAPYKPPKTVPSSSLEVSDRYIIVSLTKLPLGKDYCIEALARAGIDEKTVGSTLSGNQIMLLEQKITEIRSQARPMGFVKDGKIVDFALARLSRYKGLETTEPKTLSELADAYYADVEQPNPKLEKLQERLEKQKERMVELSEEEKRYRATGDHIYANYDKVKEAIDLAASGRFDEIEKKGGKVDKKDKKIEMEV